MSSSADHGHGRRQKVWKVIPFQPNKVNFQIIVGIEKKFVLVNWRGKLVCSSLSLVPNINQMCCLRRPETEMWTWLECIALDGQTPAQPCHAFCPNILQYFQVTVNCRFLCKVYYEYAIRHPVLHRTCSKTLSETPLCSQCTKLS